MSPAIRIVDAVQDMLREAIFGGTLRAGEALSVPELARRLNVSRSPVREAVLGLVAQGLAIEQPRRGVVVATIAADDLVAIHEVREFLEAGAAQLCARRIERAGVDRLRCILAEQKRAVKDADGYFRTNCSCTVRRRGAAMPARQILRNAHRPTGSRVTSVLSAPATRASAGYQDCRRRRARRRGGLRSHIANTVAFAGFGRNLATIAPAIPRNP
jgi:DNA-binding GntR family transcriptional regulator